MTKPRFFLCLILFIALLAACGPATSTLTPTQPVIVEPSATFPSPVPTVDISAQATEGPTETLVPTALPIATSRGPNLEATDPATVSLASGGLQLVEFFRFT